MEQECRGNPSTDCARKQSQQRKRGSSGKYLLGQLLKAQEYRGGTLVRVYLEEGGKEKVHSNN